MDPTSSLAAAGVKAAQRRIEFLHHLAKGGGQRGPPPDQDVIVAGAQWSRPGGGGKPGDLAQAAANAVSLHGIADLTRHGETDADRAVLRALPGLKHKGAAGGAHAIGRGPKIAAAFQPLDDGRAAILLTH